MFIDTTGVPHSDAMRTVERLRKVGANRVEDVVTDPRSGHVHVGLEATVKGRRRPKEERESSAKSTLTWCTRIAEETVHRPERRFQLLRIDPCRGTACCEVIP